MFIINFTKLIKIWRNSKNRIISVNKLKHEKDDDVEITVKGKFKGKEEDVSKPPKWFRDFENKINKKITRLNENFENKIPGQFKDFENKINKKITRLNENFENKVPKWFINWSENFENKIENKIPKWFKDWKKDSENKIPKWFKDWKKDSENKIPKWFKDWNEKIFIPFKEKVEKDIAAIKNTPTVKRELGLS